MKITIEKINEVHIRVTSDDKGIEKELESFFTYEFPGARYTPAFRARLWDGLVRMYNTQKNTLYVGLLDYVIEFAKRNSYTVELLNDVNVRNGITSQQVADFAKNLNPYGRGAPIEIRDYQIDAVTCALDRERVLLLSPTASGKSFIIYTTLRWHLNQNRKCIIIVPTTSLVEQLYTDFEDYSTANGWNVSKHCSKIYSGFEKDPKRVTLTLEDGSKIYLRGSQSIKTLNRGTIEALNVKEGDDIDENYLHNLQTL